MTVASYRPVVADEGGEEEAVVDLWAASLPVDRAQLVHQYRADPLRRGRTLVAAGPDGTVLSAVAYSPRDLRDAEGRPVRVGGISAVATRPDERGQGHARKLLALAVESMRREGCLWSLLFTESNDYYERLGWQTIQTSYREGLLSSERVDRAHGYSVRRYDPAREPEGWEPLSKLYDAYNASRALSLVRSLEYWRGYLAPAFTAPTALVLVARRPPDGASIDGYLLAHMLDEALIVTEIGLRPGLPGVASALLDGLRDEANERGIDRGRAYVPVEPEVDIALGQAFVGLRVGHHQAMMALPIATDFDMDRIQGIFVAPGAIYWPSDDF